MDIATCYIHDVFTVWVWYSQIITHPFLTQVCCSCGFAFLRFHFRMSPMITSGFRGTLTFGYTVCPITLLHTNVHIWKLHSHILTLMKICCYRTSNPGTHSYECDGLWHCPLTLDLSLCFNQSADRSGWEWTVMCCTHAYLPNTWVHTDKCSFLEEKSLMVKDEEWKHSGLVFVKPVTIEMKAWIVSFLTPTLGQCSRLNNCNLNRIRQVEYFKVLEEDIPKPAVFKRIQLIIHLMFRNNM